MISPGFDALYHTVPAIAIWRCGEDKEGNDSSEDAQSLQQPLGRRGVGTTGVGGLLEREILEAEGRGKQHVALSALVGDWRVTNTGDKRKCKVSTNQCCKTV